MVDFHSHILPGIDDGSRDIDESLELLRLLKLQGVETVVATPHFYANRCSVEGFLCRRQDAYDLLVQNGAGELPKIVLGAEVRYYEGISRLENLQSLCIGGTKLLLLEMPFTKWTEYTIRELIDLSCSCGLQVVLAHIDRYLSMQSFSVWKRLLECGFLMQLNADFVNRWSTRRRAIQMLATRQAHLLGSDCHNLTDRPPQMQKAFDMIQKKLGKGFISQFDDFTSNLLV